MICGCGIYPCIHSGLSLAGQLESNIIYNEMIRQQRFMNMNSIPTASNPKETEKKPNKKLLLLRK